MENFKIITASSHKQLTNKIADYIAEGWEPVGSHSVVVLHSQNRYSGSQHMDTIHETEYSISMRQVLRFNKISVDVAFYHPNDDESIKVYDEEGMREEFEYKLMELIKNS